MLKLIPFLLAAALVSAVPFRSASRRGNIHYANSTAGSSLLVSGPGFITSVLFTRNGSFEMTRNYSSPVTSPSWLLPKSPDEFYSVDENDNVTNLNFLNVPEAISASSTLGIVHLEFNADRTRMLGAGYGTATIDIFDVTAPNGSFTMVGQLASDDTPGPDQTVGHPHQVLLEPSGRYFVANDLGTDTLLVIDSTNNNYTITNHFRVTPAGCGPRHGAFFPPPDMGFSQATHYMLVCETMNFILLYKLSYTENSLNFTTVQNISTFGEASPPANATRARAGEILLDLDLLASRADVYVTNRITGNETDSISHFALSGSTDGPMSLVFLDSVSSGGLTPRSLALGADKSTLFATNQGGKSGLVAFARDKRTGTLDPKPLAAIDNSAFGLGQAGSGPQFVVHLPTTMGAFPTSTGSMASPTDCQ